MVPPLPPCVVTTDHTSGPQLSPLTLTTFLLLKRKEAENYLKGDKTLCGDTGDKSRQDGQYWKCGGTAGCRQHANQ